MNVRKQSKAVIETTFTAAISAALICGLASALWSAEPNAEATQPKTDSSLTKTNSVELKAKPADPKKIAAMKQLTGAELYSMHCNRCHPERYPTERTAAQWKTIALHMQVRANIPPPQVKLILKYLQENSGR